MAVVIHLRSWLLGMATVLLVLSVAPPMSPKWMLVATFGLLALYLVITGVKMGVLEAEL